MATNRERSILLRRGREEQRCNSGGVTKHAAAPEPTASMHAPFFRCKSRVSARSQLAQCLEVMALLRLA